MENRALRENNFRFTISAPNQQAPINTTSISQIQQYHLQHQQLRQQNLNAAAMNHATVVANNPTKVEKKAKAKKELNKQSSSESITTTTTTTIKNSNKDDTSAKCNGSTNSGTTITATQKRKDKKLKAQLAKQSSLEDTSSVESVARNSKTKTKDAIPVACNKTKRNSVEVEPQPKPTKDSQLECEPKKDERRKVKAPKYEYADPQYKTNKFDVLDLDDDEDYYISEEESIDSGVTTSTVEYTSQQNSKKNPTKANLSNKSVKQTVSTPPTPTITKAEKSKPVKEVPTQLKKDKTPVEAEVPLSKKQKKKLAQQQARQQSQATPKSSVSQGDSLNNAMHKLRLNDDTTIELVKDNHGTANCNTVSR